MTNEEIATKMSDALDSAGGTAKSVKFDFGSDGAVYAHEKSAKALGADETQEADCTITVSKEDFGKLAAGELDPMMAFMSGKLKVSGDMSVAMGLQSIFANM